MNPGTFPLSKVIVIGAGLGGLSCAIQCRRMGLGVVVLERAPEIANVSTLYILHVSFLSRLAGKRAPKVE
jgi:flavin-dependent dehydrogenase